MPLFRKTWHSVERDGFLDGSGEERAVFHFCLNCQYLETIMANNNQKRGRGKDSNGKTREPCQRCTELEDDKLCRSEFILKTKM